jgi:hypothetical protein
MAYPYYGFYGFQDLIMQWESVGVFDIILPMLLIFTVVYAILDRTKIFGKDKSAINAIISLAISLFTIQNVAVTSFFKILFSQVAFGLAVLIAVIILTALVLGHKSHHVWRMIIMILGFLIFIWIFSRAATEYENYYGVYAFGWFTSDWWAMNAPWLILLIVIAVVVIAVVASSSKQKTPLEEIAKKLVGEYEE